MLKINTITTRWTRWLIVASILGLLGCTTLQLPSSSSNSPSPAERTPPLVADGIETNSHTVSPPTPTPTVFVPPDVRKGERLLIANYYPWFEPRTFTPELVSDMPEAAYFSDDPKAIGSHIAQAREVGIDGFASAWILPRDQTDRNFARVLALSEGTTFHSAVALQTNSVPEQPQASLVSHLRYVLSAYGRHPNYLRYEGRPVLVFTNMPRVPTASGRRCQGTQECIAAWREIRAQVESLYPAIWIAEGLEPAYLEVFDGLYVIKIAHLCCPNDYLKSPWWGRRVRSYEATLGTPKLWVATIMPGWDDLRTADQPGDLRDWSPPSKRDREAGNYYEKTFAEALNSNPDWIIIHSFNEWVEGAQIEPSVSYGDKYLKMTAEFARRFKR